MKRRSMSKSSARRLFKRTSASKRVNHRLPVTRGGIRL